MTDYRKNLVDRMIRLYGFENPITVLFADMAEKYVDSPEWDRAMLFLVNAHEENPVVEE